MKITTELIKTIHDRAIQYAIEQGRETSFTSLIMIADGRLYLNGSSLSMGGGSIMITSEDLTDDLDEKYALRQQKIDDEQKEMRRHEYEKLKKEFES